MRFSDLSGRKTRENRPAAAAAKPAPAPAPVPPPQRPFRELDAEARECYSKNLSIAVELLGQIDRSYVEKYEKMLRLAKLNLRTLGENPAVLNYTAYATAGNYLHAHSANTAIISQVIGLELELEPDKAAFLGFCALAHDIGMTGYLKGVNKEGRLTDEEFSEMTLHSAAGAQKVDRIIDIDYKVKERAIKIISQVHERIDSSGYPKRLAGGEIDVFAQIIGVADVYEAMSHQRPWRETYHPHNAVKHLIDKEGRGFDSKIVKALIGAVTLYPPGSLVVLSTGEIARVVMTNKGSLTRPVVEALLDANFEPVPPQLVDLMEYPLTAVKRIVEFEEISRKNPKFAAKLELARWWVEW
ncbi:MAG: HD domain-containing protein [Elusimicrobia bacterium]|nr:HD domain-containing protein [Elusimicrobiota bacterium]